VAFTTTWGSDLFCAVRGTAWRNLGFLLIDWRKPPAAFFAESRGAASLGARQKAWFLPGWTAETDTASPVGTASALLPSDPHRLGNPSRQRLLPQRGHFPGHASQRLTRPVGTPSFQVNRAACERLRVDLDELATVRLYPRSVFAGWKLALL